MNSNNLKCGASLMVAFFVCAGLAQATDISGTISSTMTIFDSSRLVGDVTCTVSGGPCIAIRNYTGWFGTSVTLDLNGFTMTGLGDSQTGCNGAAIGGEVGILVSAQSGVIIKGPGLVQRFRNMGISLTASTGVTVTGVTLSTNCASGIFVVGGTANELTGNVSVRNGNLGNPCGGI